MVLLKYRNFATTGNDVVSGTDYDPMIPVLKLSEMYLIASENAPNLTDALENLNALKNARKVTELPLTSGQGDVNTGIMKEYKKEMYGDGQLFYYYKKNNLTPEIGGTPMIDFDVSKFVLPMPNTEVELGDN